MNERKLRRKLTDELAELKGNIRVVARCRPPNDDGSSVVEFPSGADGALEVVNDHGLTQRFEFDRVFGLGCRSDIFDHVAPVIQGCFDGVHACIFAYGQTGSGPTHTMEGPPSDRGVYFRALSGHVPRQARGCRVMCQAEHARDLQRDVDRFTDGQAHVNWKSNGVATGRMPCRV